MTSYILEYYRYSIYFIVKNSGFDIWVFLNFEI